MWQSVYLPRWNWDSECGHIPDIPGFIWNNWDTYNLQRGSALWNHTGDLGFLQVRWGSGTRAQKVGACLTSWNVFFIVSLISQEIFNRTLWNTVSEDIKSWVGFSEDERRGTKSLFWFMSGPTSLKQVWNLKNIKDFCLRHYQRV